MKSKNNSQLLILTKCNNETGTGHLKRSIQLQLSLKKENLNCKIWTDKNIETKKILNKIKDKPDIKCLQKIPLKIDEYKKFAVVIIDIAWNDRWQSKNSEKILKLIENMNNLNIRVVNIGKPKLNTSLFRSFVDIYPDGSRSRASGNISPRFVTLRKEFSLAKPKINKLFKGSIFLTMGGTDPLKLLEKALHQIVDCSFISHIFILIGNNSDVDIKFIKELLARKKKKSTFLKNVGAKKIIHSMSKSDMVVSAFGTTAFESMCLGVPVIAATHYVHQDNSARWFADLKAIEYLGCEEKNIKWGNLKNKLNYYYKNQKIAKKIAYKARSLVDGKGNARVTNLLKKTYDETLYDLDDIFIFAHPGTESLVASGVISKLVNSGKKVGIIVLGDGISSRINPSLQKNNISKLHIDLEESFEESCNALGVNVKYFFGYPDNQFDNEPLLTFVKTIETVLKRHKPNCIWTHQDSGINIDHKIVHKATMIASRPIVGSRVSKVIGFKSPGAIDWSFTNVSTVDDNWYEEIDLKSKRRLNSYNAYARINYFNHNIHRLKYIDTQLKINGKKIGVAAAESFHVIRNISRLK